MTLTNLRIQTAAIIAAAHAQGWQVEVVNKRTVRLTRPGSVELTVEGTKHGIRPRRALELIRAAPQAPPGLA